MNSKTQSLEESKKSHFRWVIVSLLFSAAAINYADRTVLSIAGPALAKSLHLNSVSMGYIFSAFGWSYVLAQLMLLNLCIPTKDLVQGMILWPCNI